MTMMESYVPEHVETNNQTYFEDVSPVLALVIQTFIQHLHNLNKVVPMVIQSTSDSALVHGSERLLVICHLCQFIHLCTRGSPGII